MKKITVGEMIEFLKEFDPSLICITHEYHGDTSYAVPPYLHHVKNQDFVHIEAISSYDLDEDDPFSHFY
jgi:hypothetical protein